MLAIPFACSRTKSITMRGVVVCPPAESRLLLSRLGADGGRTVDDDTIDEELAGRDWVKRHFDELDTPPTGVQYTPFGFKRYQAFARVRGALAERNRFSVGFDIFVGPGDYAAANPGDKAHTSARAVHGFVDIAHYPAFDREIAQGQEGTTSGRAAPCLVEEPYDFLGRDRRFRSDRILQVVTGHEVRAMVTIEPTAHWCQRRMGFNPNPIFGDEVANPLKRGFLFRARLIVRLPEVRDRRVVVL